MLKPETKMADLVYRYGSRTKTGQVVNFLSARPLTEAELKVLIKNQQPWYELRCWWDRNQANPFVNWVTDDPAGRL